MKRPHRAWAVCLGCTMMLLVCCGLCVNTFSVTQPYILAQNGFTNTQTSMISTVRLVTYVLSMLAATAYYKKLGYRLGCALSVLLAAVSFVLFAAARTLAGFYFAATVAGVAYGFGSMIPATVLMLRWFSSHRAMAIGVCSAGTGLATVLFSPLLSAVVTRFGLRSCFLFEAAVCLAAALIVFLLIRPSPQDCGCAPFGTAQAEKAPREKAAQALRPSRAQWGVLYAAVVLLGALAGTGIAHMMILFTTAGIPDAYAAGAVSVAGLMLMLGKCAFGAVCDRIGAQKTNRIFAALLLAGLALCVLSELQNIALVYLAVLLFGSGLSIATVGPTVWATDFSPLELVSRRNQHFQLCYALGSLSFSFMPGVLADLTGSYAPAYAVFFVFGVLAILPVQSIYRLGARHAGVR